MTIDPGYVGAWTVSDERCVLIDLAATAWGRVGVVLDVRPHERRPRGSARAPGVRATPDQPRWLERPGGALARVVVNLGYLAWALDVALGT
jgi:hypothetical protein